MKNSIKENFASPSQEMRVTMWHSFPYPWHLSPYKDAYHVQPCPSKGMVLLLEAWASTCTISMYCPVGWWHWGLVEPWDHSRYYCQYKLSHSITHPYTGHEHIGDYVQDQSTNRWPRSLQSKIWWEQSDKIQWTTMYFVCDCLGQMEMVSRSQHLAITSIKVNLITASIWPKSRKIIRNTMWRCILSFKVNTQSSTAPLCSNWVV